MNSTSLKPEQEPKIQLTAAERTTITHAQLVLTTGSLAGLVASILPGYYLVGRSGDCQIRPKTRSVSRRHCLLYFGSEPPQSLDGQKVSVEEGTEIPSVGVRRFHVMDLGSTSGTKLDGKLIPARQWCEIFTGSELRCGKIAWQLSLATLPPPVESLSNLDSETTNTGELDISVNMLQGNAWQGADVAAFLAASDEVDREQRYDQIRATVQQKQSQSKEFGLADEIRDELPAEGIDKAAIAADLDTTFTESLVPVSSSRKSAREPTTGTAQGNQVGKQPLTTIFLRHTPSLETLKLTLAVLLTIAVIGLGIYSFIQFRSGPPARIMDGIG